MDVFKSNLLDVGVGSKRVAEVLADVYARLPHVERPSSVPCVSRRGLSTTYTAKVTIRPNRIEGGIKPKGAQQASNGIVYKYIPGHEQCCTRNCFRHQAAKAKWESDQWTHSSVDATALLDPDSKFSKQMEGRVSKGPLASYSYGKGPLV
jgi:hypothetical protein